MLLVVVVVAVDVDVVEKGAGDTTPWPATGLAVPIVVAGGTAAAVEDSRGAVYRAVL